MAKVTQLIRDKVRTMILASQFTFLCDVLSPKSLWTRKQKRSEQMERMGKVE